MQSNRIKAEHLKKEAERLLNDQVLIHALEAAQRDALMNLAHAKTWDDTLRCQGEVAAYTNFKDKLAEYILAQE